MPRRRDQTFPQAPLLSGALTLLLVGATTGCAALPYDGTLPAGVDLTVLTSIEPGAPFAWSPSGSQIALRRAGVRVRDLHTGVEHLLAPGHPDRLAWSPSGDAIATAEQEGDSTRVRLLGLDGATRGETFLKGKLDRLAWTPDGELLVGSVIRQAFSFGSNLKTVLYRWREGSEPEAFPLAEVTLTGKNSHLTVGARGLGGGPVLSPFGDEVLCTVLRRPPAFPAYKALLLVNLGTRVIRKIAHLPPDSPGGIFSADSERALFRGAGYTTSAQGTRELVDPNAWAFPDAGRCLALSPGGRYLFAGGRLLHGSELLLTFALDVEASFGPEGRRLLVRSGDRLLLVNGLLGDPPRSVPPAVRDDLLALRRWRSLQLIRPKECEQRSRLSKAGGLAELPDPETYEKNELEIHLIELSGEINSDDNAPAESKGGLPPGKAPTARLQRLEERLLKLKASFDSRKLSDRYYGKEKARVLDEMAVGR